MPSYTPIQAAHAARIQDQFSRQAEMFAAAPELHNDEILALIVEATSPNATDIVLDVACGPGTLSIAMAKRVQKAFGLDATEAMLAQARRLAEGAGIQNAEWRRGDVYVLPFADVSFDVVTCRFAFHHFERPLDALREIVRVCKPGGKVLVCDAIASDDPAKAEAFNRMERLRDPSTVEFRPFGVLLDLFEQTGLSQPSRHFFQVTAEREQMVTRSFPAGGDYDGLRKMITDSVGGDAMGVGARLEGGTVLFAYPSVILVAVKPN